jgi:hypothetical protein
MQFQILATLEGTRRDSVLSQDVLRAGGNLLIVLLCGGDRRAQARDIALL